MKRTKPTEAGMTATNQGASSALSFGRSVNTERGLRNEIATITELVRASIALMARRSDMGIPISTLVQSSKGEL